MDRFIFSKRNFKTGKPYAYDTICHDMTSLKGLNLCIDEDNPDLRQDTCGVHYVQDDGVSLPLGILSIPRETREFRTRNGKRKLLCF